MAQEERIDDVFYEMTLREKSSRLDAERQKKLDDSIKSVMGTKHGRMVMRWILSFTGQDSSISSTDAMQMALDSGRRDVGLAILCRLNSICYDSVVQMQKENTDE